MNPHLYDILAQQRIADLQRAAEHARLASDAGAQRRDSSPIVRALPMPTAHPSPEAWPAASLPADTSPTPARCAPWRTSTEPTFSTAARTKAARGPFLPRSYELLDAHAGTEHLSQTQHSELLWNAHLGYLRDLQRVAREVLADVS